MAVCGAGLEIGAGFHERGDRPLRTGEIALLVYEPSGRAHGSPRTPVGQHHPAAHRRLAADLAVGPVQPGRGLDRHCQEAVLAARFGYDARQSVSSDPPDEAEAVPAV
jgi:hypothetical protein